MAKRVNKKFLILLTCGVMGPLLVIFFVAVFLKGKNAAHYIQLANSYYEKADYQQALDNYKRAFGQSQKDTSLLIRQGDCMAELCRSDQEMMSKFMGPWERVLEIDQKNIEALKRLYDSTKDLTEASSQAWEQMKVRAEKYFNADPSQKSAQVMIYVSDVNIWLRGGKPASDVVIKARLEALEKLLESNPTESIIPETISDARIRLARDAATGKNQSAVAENCAKAREIVDKAVELQPENAAMHFVRFTTYRQLPVLIPEKTEELVKVAAESLEKAANLAKTDQEGFVEIRLTWAQILRAQGKSEEALKALRDVVEKHPESTPAALNLAEFLRMDPKTRPEAIALLSQKPPEKEKARGFQVQKQVYGEFKRLGLLTMIQIDMCSMAEAADRPGLRQLINDNVAMLKKAAKTDPLTLKAEGAAMLLDPQEFMAGIHVLENAVDQTLAMKSNDTELYLRLAEAYLRVPDAKDRQTGQAVKMLNMVLELKPGDIKARQILIKVLNEERKHELALRHIQFFLDNKVDYQGLATDRIIALVGSGSPEKSRDLVNNLPENTSAERFTKAKMALYAKMSVVADNLARRLTQEELAEGSKEYPGTLLLTQTLVRDRKREEAKTVIQTALQKDPQNPILKRTALALSGETNLDKIFADDNLDDTTRELDGAMQRAELAARQGDTEKATDLLLAADKKFPDNIKLLTALFGCQVDLNKFDDAEKTSNKLGRMNADQAEGLTYRVQLKLAKQDYEGALKDAIDLTGKLDSFAISWVLKGQAQQGLARKQRLEDERRSGYDGAIASYTKALESQSGNFQALKGLIDCHLAIGQDSIAREVIRRGIQSENAAYFAEQSRRLEELKGDPRKVTADREKAVQDNPDNASLRVSLIDNYNAVARYVRARNDQAGADAMSAKIQKNLEEAVKQWPEDLTFASRLGQVFGNQKKFNEAMNVLAVLSEKDTWKDRPQPRALMAQYALASGNQTRAEELYLEAVKLSKDNLNYQQMLLSFYLQNDLALKGLDLMKAMVSKNDSPELRSRYVKLLIAHKQTDKAEELCRQALAKDPKDLDAMCLMALIRMGSGANAEAGQLLDDALKVNPRHSSALHYRGILKLQKNDIAGAVSDLTTARMNSPENPEIRLTLSEAQIQRGDTSAAANELEDALRYAPSRDDLRIKLVNLYFSMERWTDVKRQLEDAIESGGSTNDASWWKYLAKMWIIQNKLDNAFSAILSAAELAPSDPEVSYFILDIHFKKKQYTEIVDLTNKVIESDGDKPWWLYMQRGKAFWALKREPEAKTAFEMAMGQIDLIQSSDSAEQLTREMAQTIGLKWVHEQLAIRRMPYWLLCDMRQYIAAGEIEAGIRIADKFTDDFMKEFSPEMTTKSRIYIGETLTLAATKGDERAFNRAIEVYTAVLKDAKGLTTLIKLQVLNNMAFLYTDGTWKDYAKGLGYSQQAYDLMEKVNYINPTIADTHGWLLVLSNQLDKGIALLQTVITRDSTFPDAHYHLAEAYYRNKQYTFAKGSIDKAKDAMAKVIASDKIVEPTLEAKIKESAQRIEKALESDNPGNATSRP